MSEFFTLLFVIGFVTMLVGLVVMMFGIVLDRSERLVGAAMLTTITALAVAVGSAVFAIITSEPGKELVPGRCYEAVSETSTSLMPIRSGDVTIFIPTTSEDVVLKEVSCHGRPA